MNQVMFWISFGIKRAGVALFICSYISIVNAKPLRFDSGTSQIHLIELYSSEGCSSCPPADRWLSALNSHPQLWKKFIPIEFHVDYWNYLGWVDPFSNKRFAQRQRDYASEWGENKVVTPRFVLNGSIWESPQMNRLNTRPSGGRLRVEQKKGDEYKVIFNPAHSSKKNFRIFATVLGGGLVTKNIPRGENAGSTLRHEFVVMDMKVGSLRRVGKNYEGIINISPAQARKKAKSLGVAFWVSEASSQVPLQAVGGPLASK